MAASPALALDGAEAVTFDLASVQDGALAGQAEPPVATVQQPDMTVEGTDRAWQAETSARTLSLGEHVGAVKWELAAVLAYMTAVNVAKIADTGVRDFEFRDEGWFGTDTINLGIDKLSHAHNSYVLAELIGARIRKKTGTTRGTALSGAVLASGIMFYSELYDGFKTTSGFGAQDLLFNALGAGFSVVRNTTPGLEEKLDFRVLVIPNRNIYTFKGREHYRQLRYLFALKLSGFDSLSSSPLRYVELHGGYYGTGFTDREIARGKERERRLFVGAGVNLGHLLFGRTPRGRAARAGAEIFQYWQPPYTYLHSR